MSGDRDREAAGSRRGDSWASPPPGASGSSDNVLWAVLKNTVAQIAGRIFIMVGKLAAASLVSRTYGAEVFGRFSLVLTLVLIAEMVVDLGWNHIFVRDICQQPDRRGRLLAILAAGKRALAVLAYLVLAAMVVALGYSWEIVSATLLAGAELFFFGGVLVYRALFKATLRMEREMAAEAASVLVMLAVIGWACWMRAPLLLVVGGWTLARAVFFALAWVMARAGMRDARGPVGFEDLRTAFREALPLGLTGFVVATSFHLGPIVLSKLDSERSVGLYSGALRFMLPAVVIVESLGQSVYPVFAAYWQRRRKELRRVLQLSIEAAAAISGAVFCGYQATAEFLMGILGPDMVEAAAIVRGLSYVFFAIGISTVVVGIVVVAGKQHVALRIAMLVASLKLVLLLVFVPRYSYMGAVYAWLIVEAVGGLLPVVVLVQHYSGVRLRWGRVLRVGLAAALAILAVRVSGLSGGIWGGVVVLPVYLLATLITGAVRPAQLRALGEALRHRGKTVERVAPAAAAAESSGGKAAT